MWIHGIAALLAISMGFYFELTSLEWVVILFSIGLVLTAELLNTALEETINLVSPQFNKKAGRIKDLGAGAVLLSAITAAIIGLIVFLPKLIHIL